MEKVLYYAHDPMCSWCWAARPVWTQILEQLPAGLSVRRILGGLAPDTDQSMPEAMQAKLRSIWRTIQQQVPGTEFNFDFWRNCKPRRSTYAACRAVIAATRQGAEHEEAMILAIQRAYYLQARNPSDSDTLADLATEMGLDSKRFRKELESSDTQSELHEQIAFCRQIGAFGFPCLILELDSLYEPIAFNYNNADVVLRQLNGR